MITLAEELIELLAPCLLRRQLLLTSALRRRTPVIMQERPLQIGKWLSVNGEAIYGTRKYTSEKENGVYTQKVRRLRGC